MLRKMVGMFTAVIVASVAMMASSASPAFAGEDRHCSDFVGNEASNNRIHICFTVSIDRINNSNSIYVGDITILVDGGMRSGATGCILEWDGMATNSANGPWAVPPAYSSPSDCWYAFAHRGITYGFGNPIFDSGTSATSIQSTLKLNLYYPNAPRNTLAISYGWTDL